MHSLCSRRFRSPISRLTVVLLFVLAWSSPAFGDKNRDIHDAAQYGNLKKVKALLKDHRDLISSKDKDGNTPLHLAAIWDRMDVAEFLLANKAEVNAKNSAGNTPLHEAAICHKKEMAKLLLMNGADVTAKNNHGDTPSRCAADSNDEDVLSLLHQFGGEAVSMPKYIKYSNGVILREGAQTNPFNVVDACLFGLSHPNQVYFQSEGGAFPVGAFDGRGCMLSNGKYFVPQAASRVESPTPTPTETESTQRPLNSGDEIAVIGTGVSALWRGRGAAGHHYLRFYRDGTVISATSIGSPAEIQSWFKMPFRNTGDYSISGSSIKFSTHSPEGTVDFEGTIRGTLLELNFHSLINDNRGTEYYELVKKD
jgi:hypothetical protein